MLEPKDLLHLRYAAEPAIASGGEAATFTVTSVFTPPQGGRGEPLPPEYRSAIWMSRRGEPAFPLTTGLARDFASTFAPDGLTLAFLSTRPVQDGREGEAQVCTMPLSGGEAAPITSFKGGVVGAPKFSHDGSRIVCLSRNAVPRDPGAAVVVAELEYKADGVRNRGLRQDTPPALWVVELTTGESKLALQPVTPITGFDWLPGGGLLVAMAADADESARWVTQLYRVREPGATPERLTELELNIDQVSVSPDGSAVAVGAANLSAQFPGDDHFYWASLTGEAPLSFRQLDDGYPGSAGNHVGGDAHYGAYPSGPYWQSDGSLLAVYTLGGFGRVVRLHPDRAPETLGRLNDGPAGEWNIAALAVNANGQVAAVVEDINALTEVAVLLEHLEAGNLSLVSSLNHRFETRVESIALERDGHHVEGWVMFPAGLEEGGSYPLVHSIHGGPATSVGGAFTFEHQLLTSQGVAVLLGNIRGSSGYGEAQTAAVRGEYGHADQGDLDALLSLAITRFPWIDASRVAAVGGSYGGFMVNWLSANSTRYAAAVTERSICNWVSFWGTSDIGHNFARREHAVNSLTVDLEALWEHSPLKHVDKVRLPTLIIHSEEDHRCPIEQAEQWFVALRQRGVPVRFVRFPDESHELSRTGRPDRRVTRLEEIVGWLSAHLQAVTPGPAPE